MLTIKVPIYWAMMRTSHQMDDAVVQPRYGAEVACKAPDETEVFRPHPWFEIRPGHVSITSGARITIKPHRLSEHTSQNMRSVPFDSGVAHSAGVSCPVCSELDWKCHLSERNMTSQKMSTDSAKAQRRCGTLSKAEQGNAEIYYWYNAIRAN